MVALAGQANAQGQSEPLPSFEAEQQFPVSGFHPFGLAAGDFTGGSQGQADGYPEVAVCGSAYDILHTIDRRGQGETGGWVQVFTNAGVTNGVWNGLIPLVTIYPAIDLGGVDTAPREVAFANLTQQDALDLVVACAAPVPGTTYERWGVLVYKWNGNQYVLHSSQTYTGGAAAVQPAGGLVIADFNNDGLDDVAISVDSEEDDVPPSRARVAVFENTWSGSESGYLQLATELENADPSLKSSADIVAANFNRLEIGQPKIDLVTGNIQHESVSLLTNSATGSFVFAASTQSSACSVWPFCDMVAGQFTAGSLNWDVAGVAESGDCNLYVLHGTRTGAFSHDCQADVYPLHTNCVAGPAYRGLAIGNLNGGTRPDLVVTDPTNPGGVMWLLGKADGSFQFLKDHALYSESINGWMPMQVLCADLDQDGFDDIITSNHEVNNPNTDPFTISVLLNATNITP